MSISENRDLERKSYAKINADYKEFSNDPVARLPVIRLFYGPQEHNGFIKHKPQKLHGLVCRLKKRHYTVDMVPSSHLNVLKVEILGRDAYRCNLKYLQFNINCIYNNRCPPILKIIDESVERIYSNENVSKSPAQWIEDQMQPLSDSSMDESSMYGSDESETDSVNSDDENT